MGDGGDRSRRLCGDASLVDDGGTGLHESGGGGRGCGAEGAGCRLAGAESIRQWWRQFNDELLSGLVENAVSNNRSFLMAQQKLEQARWRLAASWSDVMPHITGAGSATRSQGGKNGTSGRKFHRDLFKAGFDATWEIDLFGGVSREIEESEARMQKANCDLADAWVSLSAEIGSQYIELRTIQERLTVARANLKLQTETYDILKSRLDSGIGDELAVNQAKYNVEQTRASIPKLLAEEESLMDSLAILAIRSRFWRERCPAHSMNSSRTAPTAIGSSSRSVSPRFRLT